MPPTIPPTDAEQTELLAGLLRTSLAMARENAGYSAFLGTGDHQAALYLAGQLPYIGIDPYTQTQPDVENEAFRQAITGWLIGASLAPLPVVEPIVDTLLEELDAWADWEQANQRIGL